MDSQGSAVNGNLKKRKYNKRARQRINKRIWLLQEEFDKKGLNLVATIKDVTGCPSFRTRISKKPRGPKISSNIVLQNKYELVNLGDRLRIIPGTSAQVGQPTEPVYIPSTKPVYTHPLTHPLICLVTPPRSNENVLTIDLTKPVPKGLSSCVRAEAEGDYRKIYFNPGRRIYSTQLINSRPVLICEFCKIKPKSEFCKDFFSCNYLYAPQETEQKKI